MDLSSISEGLSIAKSAYEALDFIRRLTGSGVISALFRYDGTRVYGSEKIDIQLHRNSNDTIWWYSVKALEDYVFIRVPVIESCTHELVGRVEGDPLPDVSFWRWIAPVLPGRIYGGGDVPNVKGRRHGLCCTISFLRYIYAGARKSGVFLILDYFVRGIKPSGFVDNKVCENILRARTAYHKRAILFFYA